MKNKSTNKNQGKNKFKWIAGILIMVAGLANFDRDPIAGTILIIIGGFILPIIQNIVNEKTNLPSPAKYLIVIFGLVIAFYVGYNNQLNEEKEADKIVQQSIVAVSNNNFSKANKLLDEAEQIYRSSDNKAVKVENNLNKLNSESFLKTSLLNLSEEELSSLKAGRLNKTILENDTLNRVFIAKMQKNAGLRAEFIKEKEKQKRIERERELERKKEAKAAAREKKIEDQFSAWDGSHRKLEDFIKKNINDPDSYEHVKTVYWDRGDFLVVKTTFRGNNAFGGKVKNSVRAKVSLDGEILEIWK
jgi:hypothetical protein